jgi:GT2 family glycosyltransferase
VVVRARDAEQDLAELLPALRSQRLPSPLEIILVDNASRDGSRELALAHGAVVVSVSDEEWSWGHALNVGFERATAPVVAVLSADACPQDAGWAAAMLAWFDDQRVAAVYGRQLPRPQAPLDEWCRVLDTFPAVLRMWTLAEVVDDAVIGLVASNSCAAYRRADWSKSPFVEGIPAEEHPWCLAAIRDGRRVVYVPKPCVLHSHEEPRRRMALRILDVSTRGRRPGRMEVLRMAARFSRLRLAHAVRAGVGTRRRVRGLLSLPSDAFAILAMGFRLAGGMTAEEARRRWWS